ncbi:hypothetical protein [Tsukamurella soli]|uniref:Uncharacterized protein n=1 Tax=Tsukamurella soli TaxID=644556 RepID=A0ABP8KGB7_9ACTN
MGRTRHTAAAIALVGVLAAGCGAQPSGRSAASSAPAGANAAAGSHELVGLFRLTPGAERGGHLTGTWFKMAIVGGTAAAGPYVTNANSTVDGGQVTPLQPGTAGGLRTGSYQTEARPGFKGGNSLSSSVTRPTGFFDVLFGISTNPVDPQTHTPLPPPSVTELDGRLTADVSAWAASWNNQEFNQGAPKPVPSTGPQPPGQQKVTRAWDWVSHRWLAQPATARTTGPQATGTYDPQTRHFTLDWSSHIAGGPFNDFTGVWHLEGTFEPSAGSPAAPSATP